MDYDCTLDKLKSQVREMALGRHDPEQVEKDVRGCLFDWQDSCDSEHIIELKLLLAKILFIKEDYVASEKVYREVLAISPKNVIALIGIAELHIQYERYSEGEAGFRIALSAAREMNSPKYVLVSLDRLALYKIIQGNADELHSIFVEMRDNIGLLCSTQDIPLAGAECALQNGYGRLVCDYFENIARLSMRLRSGGMLTLALSRLIQIQRQMAIDKELIECKVRQLLDIAEEGNDKLLEDAMKKAFALLNS